MNFFKRFSVRLPLLLVVLIVLLKLLASTHPGSNLELASRETSTWTIALIALIELFVIGIFLDYMKISNDRLKLSYITSSISTLLITLLFIPFLGGALYSTPVYFIEKILGLPDGLLVSRDMFAVFPTFIGLLISVPLWVLLGSLIGGGLYSLRIRSAQKNNSEVRKFGFGGFAIVFLIQILFCLSLYYFATK